MIHIENLTNHMETQRNHHLNKDAELTTANDKIARNQNLIKTLCITQIVLKIV